ncbi:MAG: ACP S-malonyltransferase [Victivallales bacterium]|nr:ACP S-malonyltransferase [Victivallales bacterium]
MRLGFMFAGQGAQFPGMGRDLYDSSPAAKAIFDEADEVLGRTLSKLCFEGTAEELTSCANCQPAIYAMSQACLAAFKEELPDEVPAICGGLSLGEFSAFCAAGTFGFADGLRIVAKRGELMDAACRETSGGMAAILGANMDIVSSIANEAGVDIANLNCPGQVVVSGEKTALEKALKLFADKEIRAVELTVAGAYHSRLMASASESFGRYLADVPLKKPNYPVVQNVTGTVSGEIESIRRNLTLQVCSSVRWEDCVRTMMKHCDMLVEFGPGSVLAGFMKRIDRSFPNASVNSVDSLKALLGKLIG